MAELQLGGKVIATQSGANNPVMASNVVMDNVNVSNALASATFPVGHILQTKFVYFDDFRGLCPFKTSFWPVFENFPISPTI